MTNIPEPPPAAAGSDPMEQEVIGKERAELTQGAEEARGWVSPRYCVSRSVELDLSVLEANRCVAFCGEAPEADPYRVLRTRIMHRRQGSSCNSIMVTSAVPGEGKTLTAINLAVTFAREFSQTVLLVDCDLRRQNIHQVLGYRSDKGVVDYLLNDEPLAELIVWPGIEKLTVISGGRIMNDSSELLASPRMQRLVEEMKHRYPERLIIFDLPPVLAGADALAFASLADFVLMVVLAERTSGKDVQKAVSLLPQEKVLGMVLNRGNSGGRKYYGKYPGS